MTKGDIIKLTRLLPDHAEIFLEIPGLPLDVSASVIVIDSDKQYAVLQLNVAKNG